MKNKILPNLLTVGLLIVFVISGCSYKKSEHTFQPEPGDILFQDGAVNSFSDAVKNVTTGYNEAEISHIGIVAENSKGKLVVIEAENKVKVTPLSTFLKKSHDKNGNPKVIVARLIPKYRYLIPRALKFAFKQVGKPYNSTFDINNKNAYYCSQLVYESFKEANNNKPVFNLSPMTFKNPETGKTSKFWKDYFSKLKSPIPEGRPGCNPGKISQSKNIEIIYAYGHLSGWNTSKPLPSVEK